MDASFPEHAQFITLQTIDEIQVTVLAIICLDSLSEEQATLWNIMAQDSVALYPGR